LEEVLDLSFDRFLMMMMMIYIVYKRSSFNGKSPYCDFKKHSLFLS